MKKNIFVFLLMFIVIGVSGCMKLSAKEEMISYMQEKYNEKFDIVNINTQVWSAGYAEMKLKSEKFPDYTITVRKNKDTGVFSDNYIDVLMKEPIENEFNDILAQVYDNFKVYYIPGGTTLPNNVFPNMSVPEYAKVKNTSMTIQIAVSSNSSTLDEKAEHIEQLRVLLAEKKYKCVLDIFYISDEKLTKLNDKNRNELFNEPTMKNWAEIHGHFSMGNDFEFRISNWREL